MIARWFWREWRSPSLLIVWLALSLAVACVLALGSISDRMEKGLSQQSREFMAGDRTLRSSREVPAEWIAQARKSGLTVGEQLSFAAPEADSTAGTSAASDSSASGAVDEADAKMSALADLQTKLDEYGMWSDVTRIEFADTEQIAFLYQDRISVLLGTLNDLDYKLDRARYMLNNEDGKGCAATDTGRLDFSHVSAGSTRKIYFAQGDPVLPSGYVVPEKVEPETPEETADSSLTDEETPQAAPAEDTTPEEIPLTDPARMTANEDENPI